MDIQEQEQEAKWRYDVFLSFRGEDTRHTFTGNLYAALGQERFRTFFDDGALKGGDQIADTILQALEASRISIVVLSQNFASSTWCLYELVQILECMKTKNQTVLPIFYNVDPSDLSLPRSSFGKAMLQHERRHGKGSDQVRNWKSALSQVANLNNGRHFRTSGDQSEYQFIQDIVGWVTETVPRIDIFLSFRGVDTRYSFTGFLYNALCRRRFQTFMDDRENWSPQSAIERSKLSIIVLSENYAHSSWCLDELVKILECMKTKNQLVWPILYKVEPSDLRHQRGWYGEAMTKLENRFGKDSEKVQKWRSALSEVANLKWWYLRTGYDEYEFIEKIVEMAMKI